MGKLVSYISILIAIDLLFLLTGQLALDSPSSIVVGALLDLVNVTTSVFWITFLGIVGIAGLVATSSVTGGVVSRGLNILAFAAMAVALTFLIGDFITIYVYLSSFNRPLATLIMAPITLLFGVTIAEWLRAKD